jgi:hypothetical protein
MSIEKNTTNFKSNHQTQKKITYINKTQWQLKKEGRTRRSTCSKTLLGLIKKKDLNGGREGESESEKTKN